MDVTAADQPASAAPPSAAAPPGPTTRAGRLAHVDALRAAAIGVVLLQHAGVGASPGDSGVIVFFTISGFIITSLLLRERRATGGFRVGKFYGKRLLKLGPPFVVAILIPTLVVAPFTDISALAVLGQILFFYNWLEIFAGPLSTQVLPGTDVMWSLSIEEQFYLSFAVFWVLVVRRRWWRSATVALAVSAIVWATASRWWLIHEGALVHAARGTDTRMDSIAWGVLTALLVDGRASRAASAWLRRLGHASVPVVALAAAVLATAVRDDTWAPVWRNAVFGPAAAAVIVFGLTATPSRVQQWVAALSAHPVVTTVGLASYSIYIAHFQVVRALIDPLTGTPHVVQASVQLVAGLAAGLVLYYLVEVPVLALRRRGGGRPGAGALSLTRPAVPGP